MEELISWVRFFFFFFFWRGIEVWNDLFGWSCVIGNGWTWKDLRRGPRL